MAHFLQRAACLGRKIALVMMYDVCMLLYERKGSIDVHARHALVADLAHPTGQAFRLTSL